MEIEIPLGNLTPFPCAKIVEVVAERLLKEVLPDEDFSVIVNYKGYKTLVVTWEKVG